MPEVLATFEQLNPMFTIIRLADGADLKRACELAGIQPAEVSLTQQLREKMDTEHLPKDFRIISFDGNQITISERVDGERRVRGFAVDGQPGYTDAGTQEPMSS